jgi:hypothetical protein
METTKEFYRYEIRRYANTSFDDYYSGYHIALDLIVLNLHKETEKGYWIGYGNGNYASGQKWNLKSNSRWVSKTSRKRYAYPSKEEALNSFIIRTKRRMSILNSQISDCQIGLKDALKIQDNDKRI